MSCTSEDSVDVPETCGRGSAQHCENAAEIGETPHPGHDQMSKRHFRPVKVEEVHELGRLARSERVEVDALGLVIDLQLDRHDFDSFCGSQRFF